MIELRQRVLTDFCPDGINLSYDLILGRRRKTKILFGGFFVASRGENLKCRGETIAEEISEAMKVKITS